MTEKAKKQNNNFAIFFTFELYPNHSKISKSKTIFLNFSIVKEHTVVREIRKKSLRKFKIIFILLSSGSLFAKYMG